MDRTKHPGLDCSAMPTSSALFKLKPYGITPTVVLGVIVPLYLLQCGHTAYISLLSLVLVSGIQLWRMGGQA